MLDRNTLVSIVGQEIAGYAIHEVVKADYHCTLPVKRLHRHHSIP